MVGANERESGALSASEVRKGLLNFDSKSEVLTLIEKVEAANSEPNINSSYLATEELRKIRFERKALLKKVAKCEDDEQTILAEMKVVKREDSEVVAQSDVEFAKPVSGKVTSAFGSRIHPIDHVEKEHKGIDFAGEIGDPVKAAADYRLRAFIRDQCPSWRRSRQGTKSRRDRDDRKLNWPAPSFRNPRKRRRS